jgi:glycosyltransferase involved in cell wall biosynthesis
MRILSVIPGPAFGGAHNQAVVLNGPLRDRGAETVVALPQEAEAAAARLRAGGLEAVTLPLHRLRATRRLQPHVELLKTVRGEVGALSQIVRDREIDVVQSHGITNPHGALAARKAKVASVWQIFDSRAPLPVRRAAMPAFLRLADASTVWGRALAAMHPGIEKLGTRLTFVYPPVDPGRFLPDQRRRDAARAEMGVAPDELLVGSVGVLNPQKGHEFTIRAAAALSRTRRDIKFRILGASSPAHGDYERSLYGEIEALGLRDVVSIQDPGARVSDLIQAFDIFLMTSVPRSEGMPTVILEAMMCGKPVVATDVAAVAELVDDGGTGFIVPPEDVGSIASRVGHVGSDAALRATLGERARDHALAHFNLDRLADLHLSAYEKAIAHNARR